MVPWLVLLVGAACAVWTWQLHRRRLAVLPQFAAGPGRPVPRVLIVDDQPVNRRVVARAVRRLGYQTEGAEGGWAAIDRLAREAFDAVLLECHMAGLDGYDTALEIRRREPQRRRIPLIALVADPDEEDCERCRASGMDDYLAKPIRIDELEDVLLRWTARALPVSAPLLLEDPPAH